MASEMQVYKVTLRGMTPLLMHADDPAWSDTLKAWSSKNRDRSVPGDDRSPAWTWIGYTYHDGKVLGVPSDNLRTALRDAGAMVVWSKQRSFKQLAASAILFDEVLSPIMIGADDHTVEFPEIEALLKADDFDAHVAAAKAMGFELYVKRARIGQAKHVRVRPMFSAWSCVWTCRVLDPAIKLTHLTEILRIAGTLKGLGDWRPSAPKSPGPFGKFEAEVTKA